MASFQDKVNTSEGMVHVKWYSWKGGGIFDYLFWEFTFSPKSFLFN